MQAMLLAAGLGTRLRPYTNIRPKPLFPVLNRPLIHILIDMLHDAGSTKIVVNGHHLKHLVREAVKMYPDISFQEETDILGTGGALRQALAEFSHEPVVVMNGDIFHNVDLKKLYQLHIRAGNRVTLAVHDYPQFNTIAVDHEQIRTFFPGKTISKNNLLAFTGIHIINPDVIQEIPAGQFHHIIDLYEELVIQQDKIGIVRVDESYWRDIGTPEDYLQLHCELLSGNKIQFKDIPHVNGSWFIDEKAKIGAEVILSGWGCIGKYAHIGHGANLKNCVVWNNASVPEHSRFENRIIAGPLRVQ